MYLCRNIYIKLMTMTQLTSNFTLEELTKTSMPFDNTPKPSRLPFLRCLANKLQVLRDAVGSPLYINSAYRSPDVNRAVGGVAHSFHLSGQAADISIRNLTPLQLERLESAIKASFPCQFIRYDTFWHVAYDFYSLGTSHTGIVTMEEKYPDEFKCEHSQGTTTSDL